MSSGELDAPLSKAEERLRRAELQRLDAAKVHAELEAAKLAQDAKTARLRTLRLAKEALDREAAHSAAPKPRAKKK